MISGNHLRPGAVVLVDGKVYMVESSVRAGTAQRRGSFHTKLRNVETGENLQKTFQEDDQLEEPAAFPGWLRSIAVRQSINRSVRRPPALAVEPHALEGFDGEHEAPLSSLLARERIAQLHEGLDRLATLDRSTLVAFYLHGHTLVEMSDEFAAPVGTIKRRLHVARKRLAKELECLQAV